MTGRQPPQAFMFYKLKQTRNERSDVLLDGMGRDNAIRRILTGGILLTGKCYPSDLLVSVNFINFPRRLTINRSTRCLSIIYSLYYSIHVLTDLKNLSFGPFIGTAEFNEVDGARLLRREIAKK